MSVFDYIEKYSILLAVLLPVLYFITRDFYAAYRSRKNFERHKQSLIESEKRIIELIKQSDQNKVDLINNLSSLKNKIDGSIADIDKQVNDEKEKT